MKDFDVDKLVDVLAEMLEVWGLAIADNLADFNAIKSGIRVEEAVSEEGYASGLFSGIIQDVMPILAVVSD